MPWNHWDPLAKAVAQYAQANSLAVRRGTVCIRIVSGDATVQGFFGNDNYSLDEQARRNVELFRLSLERDGIEELAFSLSDDGRSWALLIRASGGSQGMAAANQASIVITV